MPEEVFPYVPEEHNYRKPPVELTLERRMRFLYELRRTGLMYRAAELIGSNTSAIANWRKKEPEFNEAVLEAKNRYVDEKLITAAVTRAVDGVCKPIIGGQFRDEIVAHEQVYSDGLLSMLIKGARPEFRDSVKADPSKYEQGNGGVLVLPAAPATAEDWETKFGKEQENK